MPDFVNRVTLLFIFFPKNTHHVLDIPASMAEHVLSAVSSTGGVHVQPISMDLCVIFMLVHVSMLRASMEERVWIYTETSSAFALRTTKVSYSFNTF